MVLPEIHSFTLLGITFQSWGLFVALGFSLGTFLVWRRAKNRALDPNAVLDMAFWIFIAAFVGARLFHVLAYDPAHYIANPWDAIDPRQPGFSIFGGFLGSIAAFLWFVRRRSLDWKKYADVAVWGLPWGEGVGRIGCLLNRLHLGTPTEFFLGVNYPDGVVRHDLGLYLSLLGFATGLLFLFFNRKDRNPGFWLGAYAVIESVGRFGLDFLRVEDVRYFGLTPAQYLAIPLLIAGFWILNHKSRISS